MEISPDFEWSAYDFFSCVQFPWKKVHVLNTRIISPEGDCENRTPWVHSEVLYFFPSQSWSYTHFWIKSIGWINSCFFPATEKNIDLSSKMERHMNFAWKKLGNETQPTVLLNTGDHTGSALAGKVKHTGSFFLSLRILGIKWMNDPATLTGTKIHYFGPFDVLSILLCPTKRF